MKILVAEDDVISCIALEKSIKDWGYDVVTANNGKQAWQIIKSSKIRLCILDWGIPGIDGVELCHKIRQEYQPYISKYIYIILITGRDLKNDVIKGLSAGADDYVTKPFDFTELKIRIQNAEQRIKLEDIRIKEATHDSLTKLWNRKKILEFLEEEIERGSRLNHPTGVIMVGIDKFKKINDSYSRSTGDKILSEVSSRLQKSIRRYDKIGRYSGDKMLAVIPNGTCANIKPIVSRMLLSIDKKIFKTDTGQFNITISIGGTSTEKAPPSSVRALLKACDKALCSAKTQGKSQFIIT